MPKRSSRPRKPPAAAVTMDAVRRMSLWLACVFPAPAPVRVRWHRRLDKRCFGLCLPRGDHLEIQLQPGMSFELALETLTHEWAHARTAVGGTVGESIHPPRFWLELGEISNRWHDTGCFAAKRLWLPR